MRPWQPFGARLFRAFFPRRRWLKALTSTVRPRRSPQEVLGLPPEERFPKRADVKARFRLLAKQLHPDLNALPEAKEQMAELLEAYDALLGGDISGLARSSVAFSCEIFEVEELAQDGLHSVYPVQVIFHSPAAEASSTALQGASLSSSCLASEDDSVLDLKRHLEQLQGTEWGLSERGRDRFGLALGWELVFRGSALSYHLFLHDYGIRHGDLLHAVVRR